MTQKGKAEWCANTARLLKLQDSWLLQGTRRTCELFWLQRSRAGKIVNTAFEPAQPKEARACEPIFARPRTAVAVGR